MTNGQKAMIFSQNEIGGKPGNSCGCEFFGRHFLTMNFLEKHIQIFLLFYILIGGFSFYLLNITIDTIFVPIVEQPEGFLEIRRARIELILTEIAEKIQLASREGNGP